ncbi:unnamed protein product [Dimorphilus gyrociliatus]|uniref:Uncharacterized protein n=1 Tax=Dimorphilus gyrociliatus TaxID=2664684 RepID=A0A7I8VHP9_9ANNE|nr:unnamed protein product [Dimorphilus gyrociliatus]
MSVKQRYRGETLNLLRNGFGVYQYENEFYRYEGEWKDGMKHGHGKLIMKDGSFYEGEFSKGEIEGHGCRFSALTGNKYSGQFHQGEFHGHGTMYYGDGSVYEGEWSSNKRQGYGIFKCKNNEVYEGYLYDNKRHGEGTMIYENGDRYDGDWVVNMRQGHGEFRMADGSSYDGQFMNDVFNGHGSFNHSSGMIYEGLWINGLPAEMPTKLRFTEELIEVQQGRLFSASVECINDKGNVIEDQNREIHITAGFRLVEVEVKKGKGKKSSTQEKPLFDMIEDFEEKPIDTPFGFRMISYPLTDQLQEEDPEYSRQGTELSEVRETEAVDEQTTEQEQPVEPQPLPADEQKQSDNCDHEGFVVPQGVNNKRTVEGKVFFSDLSLVAAPPMYRPFTYLEEADKQRNRSRDRTPDSLKKEKKKEDETESITSSRPSTRKISRASLNPLDDKFAKPEEYILMAADVTSPSFFGTRLEPAFCRVRVTPAPKLKAKRKPKERGPR